MALRPVILRTARYLENIWHPAGTHVSIPEEHFDPALHAIPPVVQPPEPVPPPSPTATQLATQAHERITQIEGELVSRLTLLENSAVSISDFAALHARVQQLETQLKALMMPPAVPPVTPPSGPDVPPQEPAQHGG